MPFQFCSNRLESVDGAKNFLAMEATCFNDVVLIPACTGLYILLLTLLPMSADNATYIGILYAQFIFCFLEIIRLFFADQGIGLLPLTLVGLILAGCLYLTNGFYGRVRGWWWANLGLWFALIWASWKKMKWLDTQLPSNNKRMETNYMVGDQLKDISGQIMLYLMLIVVTTLFATIRIADYYGSLADGKIKSSIEKRGGLLRGYFTPSATPAPEPRRVSSARQRK